MDYEHDSRSKTLNRVLNIYKDFLAEAEVERLGRDHPRVLLVEDEDFDRYLLEKLLHSQNCEVLPCVTGDQAMAILMQDQPIDLAFLDLALPGSYNGIDVMRKLKEKFPKTHVVVITGAVNAALLDDARKLGYFGMVFKPLNDDIVGGIVDTYRQSQGKPKPSSPG